jgi:hypothetical protein
MENDVVAHLSRVVNRLVHDVVQLRQELAALQEAYATHTHGENSAAAYTQNATTTGPSAPGPQIQGVYGEYV